VHAELDYCVRSACRDVVVELWLHSADGVLLLVTGEHDRAPGLLGKREPGQYRTRCRIPGNLLQTGGYHLLVNSGVRDLETYDHVDALRFDVIERNGVSARFNRRSLLAPMLAWETKTV
jgi:hypothetical protein